MLEKLINELKNISHNPNTFADKKHEKTAKSILLSLGASEIFKIEKPAKKTSQDVIEQFRIQELLRDKNNILKHIKELEHQFLFIEQPFGSQMPPDFIISIYGYIIWLECKSGKNGNSIQWNSGYPRENVLYMYSTKSTNNTTLFFGQFTQIRGLYPDFEEDYNNLDIKHKNNGDVLFNESFGDAKNFSLYTRRMLIDKTNYDDEHLRNDFFKKTKELLNIC